MKTSNKILLFIGAALLISPFINAYSIKSKLKNKEYTLMSSLGKNPTEFNKDKTALVNIIPTDSIHIIGGANLTVYITYSDTASIQKTASVEIKEKNGVLNIVYLNDKSKDESNNGYVLIKTPLLKSISIAGDKITNTTKSGNSRETITRYSPFSVTIQGFNSNDLFINSTNGGGYIQLENNIIHQARIKSEENAVIVVKNNTIGTLNLETKAASDILIDGGQIKTLITDLDQKSKLNIIGGLKGTISSNSVQ